MDMSCIGAWVGVLRPGIAAGAMSTSRPRPRRIAAVPYEATRRHGSVFSTAIRPATTAIQVRLMMPNAKSASHERPATADAPGTVLGAHPQRARPAVAPRAEEEAERAAALPEADVLQRRQLVDGRDDERGACRPSTGAVPREDVTRDRVHDRADREHDHAGGGPGDEIARREQERRQRRSLPVMREYSATVGATDGNIIAAIITIQTDRNQPNVPRPVQGPSSIPCIWSAVHHQPAAASANSTTTSPRRVRTAENAGASPPPWGRRCRCRRAHGVTPPRRTRTSRGRSCPRTGCRRR